MSNVGLAVMRLQPLHSGHLRIINRMIANCDTVIIGIGSSDKSFTAHNPYTIEDRMQMLRNVYGNRIKIIPLKDLGLTEVTREWADFVMKKIKKVDMPTPTEYWTGSKADAVFYQEHFYTDQMLANAKEEMLDGYIIGKMIGPLRIVDRGANPVPSATEMRTFLQLHDDSWKQWVPAVNWDIVENNYPDEYRMKKSTDVRPAVTILKNELLNRFSELDIDKQMKIIKKLKLDDNDDNYPVYQHFMIAFKRAHERGQLDQLQEEIDNA